MPDIPDIITIKVTTNDARHSYFVHFNRDGHDLLDVCEYVPIYTPLKGFRMPRRIKDIVETARTKLTPEGATNADHV